jgi:hypothetical protein
MDIKYAQRGYKKPHKHDRAMKNREIHTEIKLIHFHIMFHCQIIGKSNAVSSSVGAFEQPDPLISALAILTKLQYQEERQPQRKSQRE